MEGHYFAHCNYEPMQNVGCQREIVSLPNSICVGAEDSDATLQSVAETMRLFLRPLTQMFLKALTTT
jgi:hypothetical protein